MLVELHEAVIIRLCSSHRHALGPDDEDLPFRLPFLHQIHGAVVSGSPTAQGLHQLRIFPIDQTIKGIDLAAVLLAVTLLPGQNQDILPVALLHGMNQGNGIGDAPVQTGGAVHLYHMTEDRHITGGRYDIHQPLLVLTLIQIIRLAGQAIGYHQLAGDL